MTKDEKFLKQARERWTLAEAADKDQRERELDDLRFYAGEQWDDDILKARKGNTIGTGANQQVVPARPSLTINKTREPVRQVLNQERQSDLGIELIPADDWGEVTGPIDHTEIELREGLVRRIQRDSEAADARTWAFARATIAGRGYWLVMTRYVPGKTTDQEVYIERIYNQASVLLDPSHEQPDGSDANWAFYGRDMLLSEFKAEFPDAKLTRYLGDHEDQKWRALGDEAPGWFTGEGDKRAVRVMNYYYTEFTSQTLYHLSNGQAVTAEEKTTLPDGVTILTNDDGSEQSHAETTRSVKWAKITGNEILDRTDWPGHWLPIIKTVGEELQPYDQNRRCEGIVRPMRDSCKGNNYVISKFVERVGLTSIPPWMMAGGQDEGYEAEWDAANTRTLTRLRYNQKDQFGQPASPPFRTDQRAEIADLATGVQIFGQAIQSTSVVPETALGNTDPTVKSGKLARALIEQGERGTSNFMDNLARSERHEARVVNDLLYPIYGRSGRLARMVNGQGEKAAVLIGRPFKVEGQGLTAKPVPVDIPGWQPGMPLPDGVKYFGLTKDANFNIAFKVTKKLETRRQEIAQFLGELIASSPEQMAIVGDKLWKYLDVPDHEEIEKRYQVMLAPPIQQLLSNQTPLPPEAQQKIAMLEAQVQELSQLADKNVSDLKKAQLAEQEETKRADMEIQSRERIAMSQNQVKLTDIEAKINLAVAQAMIKFQTEQNAQAFAAQQAREQHAMTLQQAEQGQQHAITQGEQQHQSALAQGQQGHEQALEQGDMQHAQALQQAELAHAQTLEQQATAPTPQR